MWAVATIARLIHAGAKLTVRWDEGLEYRGFVGTYSLDLFSIDGCRFVGDSPPGVVVIDKLFSRTELNDRSLIELEDGSHQIVLRGGQMWGTSNPTRLHDDLVRFGLGREITLQQVTETFRAVARGTRPTSAVDAAIPRDIDDRVGIHVRLTDKLVRKENSYEMSAKTWRTIERDTASRIDAYVATATPLFVCADDLSYRAKLVKRIQAAGGDVVCAPPAAANRDLPGFDALVDFFALTRCREIVQMTKYSTFSMAAAIAGDAPLVNLYRAERAVGHRLKLWQSVLARAEVT